MRYIISKTRIRNTSFLLPKRLFLAMILLYSTILTISEEFGQQLTPLAEVKA